MGDNVEVSQLNDECVKRTPTVNRELDTLIASGKEHHRVEVLWWT